MRTGWLLALSLLIAIVSPGNGTCGPLLNEVLADPAADWDGDGLNSVRNDEWVEIVNPGPGGLDLDGYLLADDLGHPVFGFTGTLDAGAVRVVYGGESTAWESQHGENATGLRLGNDGDTVLLLQVMGADTLVVDAFTYTTHEAEDDRSSGRNPDGGTWELFDGLNPYTGSVPPLGNGLDPTPGFSNGGEPPVPITSATWGSVKALFSRD